MTEDQKYEITVLAESYSNAKHRFECLGTMNVYGLSTEESTRRSIEYHLAEAEKLEAWGKLEAAKLRLAVP